VPDLETLSIDQQYALRLAATTLHTEFSDFFSTETIECSRRRAKTSSPTGRSSPTSSR
jgi:hypothetical protein